MDANNKLRRQVSRLYATGVDPYNTADSIRVSEQLTLDFVEWVRSPQGEPVENPALMRRQAD
jgi:hypothetical protein